MKGLVVDFPRSPSPVIEWESEDELENNIVERNKSSSKGGNVADHTTTLVHSVLKGGGQKNVFFRENQRFVLVNWVKLLNVQP